MLLVLLRYSKLYWRGTVWWTLERKIQTSSNLAGRRSKGPFNRHCLLDSLFMAADLSTGHNGSLSFVFIKRGRSYRFRDWVILFLFRTALTEIWPLRVLLRGVFRRTACYFQTNGRNLKGDSDDFPHWKIPSLILPVNIFIRPRSTSAELLS